jgi:hypothetical protein
LRPFLPWRTVAKRDCAFEVSIILHVRTTRGVRCQAG